MFLFDIFNQTFRNYIKTAVHSYLSVTRIDCITLYFPAAPHYSFQSPEPAFCTARTNQSKIHKN
jgi:hypothetical protein